MAENIWYDTLDESFSICLFYKQNYVHNFILNDKFRKVFKN